MIHPIQHLPGQTLRKKSKGGLVIARQYFAFLRCGSSLHDSETAAGESSLGGQVGSG
jgi:hypothetical protein